MSNYKNPVCRSITGCGRCERCAERRCQAVKAEKADTFDPMATAAPLQKETYEKLNASAPVAGLPVKGYKPTQEPWKIDLVNENKILEELTLRQIEVHQEHGPQIDQRFVALARTKIQEAFMELNRAVFQPERLADTDGVGALILKLNTRGR